MIRRKKHLKLSIVVVLSEQMCTWIFLLKFDYHELNSNQGQKLQVPRLQAQWSPNSALAAWNMDTCQLQPISVVVNIQTEQELLIWYWISVQQVSRCLWE